MKRPTLNTKLALLAISCGLFCSLGQAGELALSDEVNLKISRIKSQSRQMQHEGIDDYIDLEERNLGQSESECGSVDIGNLETNRRPTFGNIEQQTIVIGDVINAGNRC